MSIVNKQRVAILTDTNCDLPKEIYLQYPIFRLPLVIRDEADIEYRDGLSISVEDVYARQKDEHFRTSLPQREQVEVLLDTIRCAGYDQVLVLLLGSSLSGTTNLLRLMADELEGMELAVFDTKSASVGVGMLALQAAIYAQKGLPFHVLKRLTAQLIEDTTVFFSIDTLEYLQRGGRIGKATALAGSLLQIKPVLSFDETGTIYTPTKVRGRKAVAPKLIELVQGVAAAKPSRLRYNLMICDGSCPEEGAVLETALKKVLPNPELVLHGQIDATLAVHLGPNLLGVGIQILRSEL